MKDISIIIVNYNTATLIADCINSILAQQDISYEIIVIDNASVDNSVSILSEYSEQGFINLRLCSENIGFGRGCNHGVTFATGRYIFLLNPDAKLTNGYDLKQIVEHMDLCPKIGVLGPRVINKKREPIPQLRYPGEKYPGQTFKQLPGRIAWVIGAAMVIPSNLFKRVNGFDEDFFLYGEETDLQLRIRKSGYEIAYFPKVIVHHIGGASEQKTPTHEIWLKKQNGKHLFYKKHYNVKQVRAIVTSKLWSARCKLLVLNYKARTGFKQKDLKEKQIRYKIIIETSVKFLKSIR